MVFQLVDDGAVIPATPVAAGLVAPEGLAVAPDGGLLVVDAGAHRAPSIDLASGTVTPIITGLANGVVGPPTMPPTYIFDGIAVGPSGTIYVSANGIHRYELRP